MGVVGYGDWGEYMKWHHLGCYPTTERDPSLAKVWQRGGVALLVRAKTRDHATRDHAAQKTTRSEMGAAHFVREW